MTFPGLSLRSILVVAGCRRGGMAFIRFEGRRRVRFSQSGFPVGSLCPEPTSLRVESCPASLAHRLTLCRGLCSADRRRVEVKTARCAPCWTQASSLAAAASKQTGFPRDWSATTPPAHIAVPVCCPVHLRSRRRLQVHRLLQRRIRRQARSRAASESAGHWSSCCRSLWRRRRPRSRSPSFRAHRNSCRLS